MSILANPQQLLKGLQAIFIEALMAPRASVMEAIATYVKSESDQEDYAWLGEVAQVVEFDGEVQYNDLSETANRGFNALNLTYAGGLQIRRNDLADEKTGGLRQRVMDLSVRADMHKDEMVIGVLTGNPLAYDGVALYSDTHIARGSSGTIDNLLGGTGTSTAQVATDINASIAQLFDVLDEAGLPLNRGFRRLAIVYPTVLNKPMKEAVRAPVVSQTSNVQFLEEDIQLIREPLLTSTDVNDWYTFLTDAPVRGVIYQDREPVEFAALEGAASDDTFDREVYKYKVRKRAVAKAGRFQRTNKTVN